jgi:hypothetical protein
LCHNQKVVNFLIRDAYHSTLAAHLSVHLLKIEKILFGAITLVLFSCNAPTADRKTNFALTDSIVITKPADSIHVTALPDSPQAKDDGKDAEVIVQNKSDYSEKFIEGLRKHRGYQKFELSGNRMIIDEKDTATFPETPKIGEKFTLTGLKDNVAIALIVKRINYTTIEYSIEIVEFGKANHFEKGQASIISLFFYGSEMDENSLDGGNNYSSTEYIDEKENDCRVSIRLGKDGDRKELLGKLIKNCNGKIKEITLDNFPTLVEK